MIEQISFRCRMPSVASTDEGALMDLSDYCADHGMHTLRVRLPNGQLMMSIFNSGDASAFERLAAYIQTRYNELNA